MKQAMIGLREETQAELNDIKELTRRSEMGCEFLFELCALFADLG